MAYTIIDVERLTGIGSRKLRFWISKGLFPSLERDKHNIAYFSEADVSWARWVEYFRISKMSVKTIAEYARLFSYGDSKLGERIEMLKKQREILRKEILQAQKILEAFDKSIDECEIKCSQINNKKKKVNVVNVPNIKDDLNKNLS